MSESMFFPFCVSIGGDSVLLLIFPVTPVYSSCCIKPHTWVPWLSLVLPHTQFFQYHSTGHLLKKGLLIPLTTGRFKWEAVSFTLDEERHEDNPGKLLLIQVSEPVGKFWVSVRAGWHRSPCEHCANLHCVLPQTLAWNRAFLSVSYLYFYCSL